MNIRPIKTEEDYEYTLELIDSLMNAKKDTPAGDKLDVLVTLVEKYESIHHPVPPPAPLEAIKIKIEEEGYTKSDLAKVFGGRNRVSEVLQGKRALNLKMVKRVHDEFNIPYEHLIA
ncbi:MAG: helix-turn-helix domain-containing protein [Fibrobacterales bacterium]